MENKNMKRISILLIIREMQIKTTVRHHYTPIRIVKLKRMTLPGVGEDMELAYPAGVV